MRLSQTASLLFSFRANLSSRSVDDSPTFFRSARTRQIRAVIVEIIIQCQFFARFNRSAADKKYPSATDSCIKIRVAAMIDKFRAASADCAINRPFLVEPKDIQMLPDASAPNFPRINLLSRIFNHSPPGRNIFRRENSPPMNRRRIVI